MVRPALDQQGEGAFALLQRVADLAFDGGLPGAGDEVQDDFGVGGGIEQRALLAPVHA